MAIWPSLFAYSPRPFLALGALSITRRYEKHSLLYVSILVTNSEKPSPGRRDGFLALLVQSVLHTHTTKPSLALTALSEVIMNMFLPCMDASIFVEAVCTDITRARHSFLPKKCYEMPSLPCMNHHSRKFVIGQNARSHILLSMQARMMLGFDALKQWCGFKSCIDHGTDLKIFTACRHD